MDYTKTVLIEKLVRENFAFLQNEFEFPPFTAHQMRDEYYVNAQKGTVYLSVYIQIEDDYPPLITVSHAEQDDGDPEYTRIANSHYLHELEKDGPLEQLMNYRGIENMEKYIVGCAEILKRNKMILQKD